MSSVHQWRRKGGRWGRAVPGGTFMGKAKFELYLKIWVGEKYFEAGGNIFMGKFQISKKKPGGGGKPRISPGRQTPLLRHWCPHYTVNMGINGQFHVK